MDANTINAMVAKIEEAARLLWNEARTPKQETAARSIINGAQVIARLTSSIEGAM